MIVAEGEECVQTVEKNQKLVSLIDDHLPNGKLNARNVLIINTVGETIRFLRENNHILILNSDKGGNSVTMYKDDYRLKCSYC